MKNFKEWIKAAGLRALRTFAQAFGAAIVIGRFAETEWLTALETAVLAALVSLLMSIGGLPELDKQQIEQSNNNDEEDGI